MSGNTKIYFAGSIRGGRQDAELYARIIEQLKAYGKVFTEHVGDPNLAEGEVGISDKFIHDRDLDWLRESDVLVAECTQTSLGVGYEIGRAVTMDKKILCLFRPETGRKISAMISGAADDKRFFCKNYKEEDLPQILKEFFGC